LSRQIQHVIKCESRNVQRIKGQYLVAQIVCNIIQIYCDNVSKDLNLNIEIQRDNSSNGKSYMSHNSKDGMMDMSSICICINVTRYLQPCKKMPKSYDYLNMCIQYILE
jgi:hypothetical protein